jgi:hypothetical protein
MVVMAAPATCPTATKQAQAAAPSIMTVQAPQSPASQPDLVPFNCSGPRKTSLNRWPGFAVTWCWWPFTVNCNLLAFVVAI